MEPTSLLPDVLKAVAMSSLNILVCLAGCIVVMVRWRSLRSAAVPAFLGLGLFLLLSVVSPALWTVLPRVMAEKGVTDMGVILKIVGVVQSALWSVALGLVVLGVVLGRNQPPTLPK
ncbi:MAG: hypothetical protein ACAI34_21615 [Verrucomicrobium sp.]|nr:hypothetical protein [Verrucomicrobium sp.]